MNVANHAACLPPTALEVELAHAMLSWTEAHGVISQQDISRLHVLPSANLAGREGSRSFI